MGEKDFSEITEGLETLEARLTDAAEALRLMGLGFVAQRVSDQAADVRTQAEALYRDYAEALVTAEAVLRTHRLMEDALEHQPQPALTQRPEEEEEEPLVEIEAAPAGGWEDLGHPTMDVSTPPPLEYAPQRVELDKTQVIPAVPSVPTRAKEVIQQFYDNGRVYARDRV